jgi:hypothetical protein
MKIKILFLLLFTCAVTFADFPPHVPRTVDGLIYFPCDFNKWGGPFENYANVLRTIWCLHGYSIYWADYIVGGPPGDPGNVTFDYFFDYCLNTGHHSYINIFTHGALAAGQSWLAVEYYLTQQEALYRKDFLAEKYNAWGLIEIGLTPEGDWAVIISAEFFRYRITNLLPFSLTFINACHSAGGSPSVAQTFIERGAECVFGWSTTAIGSQMLAPLYIFYGMGGSNYPGGGGLPPVNQDELRNKSAGVAHAEFNDPNLVLLGNSDMRMYNSPRIVGLEITQGGNLIYRYRFSEQGEPPTYPYLWDYPGDLSGCPREEAVVSDQILEVKILFSSPMNPASADVAIIAEQGTFSLLVNGNFSSSFFVNDLWVGACDFSEWSGGENAIVWVDAEDAFQGDMNAKLDIDGDGNSNEEDKNHKFKVELPPQVVSTDPADGAADVDVYKNITITFNKEMDQSSVNDNTVTFTPQLQAGFTPFWSDGKTVTLTINDLQQDLKFYTNYNVTVTDGVKDIDGTQLDGDKDGNYRLPILDGRFQMVYNNFANILATRNFENLDIDLGYSFNIIQGIADGDMRY